MGLLDTIAALRETTDAYTGDVISSGLQIAFVPGEETITPLDGEQTYLYGGTKVGLYRLRIQDQGGMLVANVGLSFQHEVIGIIEAPTEEHPNGRRVPHPAYSSKSFLGWGGWVHLGSTQFMNVVNMDDYQRLMDLVGNGYGNYKVFDRQREPEEGAEVRESKAEVLFDMEPRGANVQQRHANAIPLSRATIVVEDPVLDDDGNRIPLIGEYLDKATQELKRRPGFTHPIDVLNHNAAGLMAALALPRDFENRSDIVKQARSQMSMLTGNDETDPENRYPMRPTLASLTLATPPIMDGEDPGKYEERIAGLDPLLQGFEIDLFKGSRDDAPAGTNTGGALAEAYTGGETPFAPKTGS